MPIFTYSEYLSIIPEDTKSFVRRLLSYLHSMDSIEYGTTYIGDSGDIFLFKALKAYTDSNEKTLVQHKHMVIHAIIVYLIIIMETQIIQRHSPIFIMSLHHLLIKKNMP